jgi:plasmid stability protein
VDDLAQVLVRDLPDDVVERLKARARAHGNSLEAELRMLLREASLYPATDLRHVADEIAAATADRGRLTDSVELLREDRAR